MINLKNKIIFFSTILLLFFMVKINFSKNLYETLFIRIDDRISNVYGFCDGEGIGYVNFIKKNFNVDKKLSLLNSLKENNNNSGKWSVYNPNVNENDKTEYFIIINLKKIKKEINLNDFKILHNFNDCYFLVKK
mgnify:CR=1 FL=1